MAFGGTLYGDLEEFPEGGADHPGAKWDEWRALVAATLEGTRAPAAPDAPGRHRAGVAARVAPRRARVVDSYHHQAIERLGEGLEAVAWAPHGVIEAVEMPGATAFVLGVQWELHEEWQDDERIARDLAGVRRGRRPSAPTPGRRPTVGMTRVDRDRHDAVDADAAAAFWKAALGYERLYERGPYTVLGPPTGDTGRAC